MGVHDWLVEWYPNGGAGDAVDITDAVKVTDKEGLKTKTSTFEISLKDCWNISAPDWVNADSHADDRWMIRPDDIIKIYADAANPITKTSTQLIMVGDVLELKIKMSSKGTSFVVKGANKTHLALSKIPPKSDYIGMKKSGTTDGTTSDKLVDSGASFEDEVAVDMVVKNTTDTTTTYITAIDSDTVLSLNDDIFVSGEGYEIGWSAPSVIKNMVALTTSGDITTTNVSMTRSGGGSNWPFATTGGVGKSLYEWINVLSGTLYTNTAAEIASGSLTEKKDYLFWVDEDNDLHWGYPSTSIDYTLNEQSTAIRSADFKMSVNDVVNMIIYRCGEDKVGASITWYAYDMSTEQVNLRIRLWPMTHISDWIRIKGVDTDGKRLMDHHTTLNEGAELTATDTTITISDASGFPSSGTLQLSSGSAREYVTYSGKSTNNLTGCTRGKYGTAAKRHADGVFAADVTYYGSISNSDFRKLCKDGGIQICNAYFKDHGSPKWLGNIDVEGVKYRPGQLIDLTAPSLGFYGKNFRIDDVSHTLNAKGWFTVLKLKEEQVELKVSAPQYGLGLYSTSGF